MASVNDVLARDFRDLLLSDITALASVPEEDERESLVLEFKETADGDAIAKGVSAFANSIGGLLVIGVTSAGTITGIENPPAEPQVWVKDVLRPRVLPMPAFRARSIALDNDRALLLILVEQSTATPHLLIGRGTIYVRSPGASDPLPVADQRTLLDLLERGRLSRTSASERAAGLVIGNAYDLALAFAATGVTDDYPERVWHSADRCAAAHADVFGPLPAQRSFVVAKQTVRHFQTGLIVERRQTSDYDDDVVEVRTLGVYDDGSLAFYEGRRTHDNSITQRDDGLGSIGEEIRGRFDRIVAAAQALLDDLGAHGDIAGALDFAVPGTLHIGGRPRKMASRVSNRGWLSLSKESAERFTNSCYVAVARGAGVDPRELNQEPVR